MAVESGPVTCPQCGGQASKTEMTNTGEYDVACPYCGHHQWTTALRSRATREILLKKSGEPIVRWSGYVGRGACGIRARSGYLTTGVYIVPVTEAVVEDFARQIAEEQIDAGGCWLTRWNRSTKQVEFVIGNSQIVADAMGYGDD